MSIFNIFGKKPQTIESETDYKQTKTEELENQLDNIPPVDLFIDNEPPHIEEIEEPKQSEITLFLNRDFHKMGSGDGYEFHSSDTLETGLKKIRAEFQLIIDQSIQEKIDKRLKLTNLIVDVVDISDKTVNKLENTVLELNTTLDLLERQKELSAENEGWVMNAIHNYNQGFIQGLNDYISIENLLNLAKNV